MVSNSMACGTIGSQMTYVCKLWTWNMCSEFWRKDGRLLRIASRPNQAQRRSISGY